MNIDILESILQDERTWEEITKKQYAEFLRETELTKKDKNFNRCDFQDFIQYAEKKKRLSSKGRAED